MTSKYHLLNLPPVQVPTHHPRDSELVALSVPIFHSAKGRNALFLNDEKAFDVEAFKTVVCLSSVWAAVSIATNTDLCEKGMPIYFHVEDKVMEIARPILKVCGVPDDWIRETTIQQPEVEVVEAVYGKKMAVYDDSAVDTEVVVVWDGDALVYRGQTDTVFAWYRHFETDLREMPLFSFYSDWNGGDLLYPNWLLRGSGLAEREFLDDDPQGPIKRELAESDAYKAVGLPRVPNQQHRWGAAVIAVPRKHGLFAHIRENYWKSYAEEALVTMYMNSYPETPYAEVSKKLLPFVQKDEEFIKAQKDCIVHIPGARLEDLPRYKNKLHRGIDGRHREKKHLTRRSKKRVIVFGVPHNPANKRFSHCAFSQKARKLTWMSDYLGHETLYFGSDLCEVNCTEHIEVVTAADIEDTYPGSLDYPNVTRHDVNDYVFKKFFLNAEHEYRKRAMKDDILCYVIGWHMRPLYNQLQDLDVLHIESGIGYYHAYMHYKVFESAAVRDFTYGGYNSNYNYYANLTDEQKADYNIDWNTHVHHSQPQWQDEIIPNSFDAEDFKYNPRKGGDYFLYLGRIMRGKGVEEAMRIAAACGKKLVIAGEGDFRERMGFEPWDCVELVGPVGVEQRADLYYNAELVFCISHYPEPFGGVVIEAALSGRPTITSKFGAHWTNVRHGVTGFRMSDYDEGVQYAKRIDEIEPAECRAWGLRFSNEKVALQYDKYFDRILRYKQNDQSIYWVTNPNSVFDQLNDV